MLANERKHKTLIRANASEHDGSYRMPDSSSMFRPCLLFHMIWLIAKVLQDVVPTRQELYGWGAPGFFQSFYKWLCYGRLICPRSLQVKHLNAPFRQAEPCRA